MDTAIEREFAGGRFTFYLGMQGILAVEKGPITPALRQRDYPVSVFQIYDELSAGIGLDSEGKPVRLPGSRIYYGDLHNILEQALKGGNAGERDGDSFEVGTSMASRLVNDHLAGDYEACLVLAWNVLHSTIKGVQLKKKVDEAVKPKPRRRSSADKS